MTRVILDCDPGIDDTYALMYIAALHHEGSLELSCLSTSPGNTTSSQSAQNAAFVLAECGLNTIPVAAGAEAPLVLPLTTTPETHGDTGLGYVTAPNRHVDTDWEELWIDAIQRGTEDLHLIVTGPCTNLALFAARHPEHFAQLKHITVMGGAVNYPGNTTPTAEWNFWVDPHAADYVFNFNAAQAPITLCPLNVTEQLTLTPDVLEWIVQALGQAPIAQHLPEITRFYFEFHEDVGEGYRAQIHDLLTVLVALGKVSRTTQGATIAVEAESELMRGTVSADLRGMWEREPNANILTFADTQVAWPLFLAACETIGRFHSGDIAIEDRYRRQAED